MSGFEIIPAIDLLGGEAVRLTQGRYEEATVYGTDPGEVAAGFVRHPLRRLHVVDLDGAKAGAPRNDAAVAAIVERSQGVPVQVGGGLRRLGDIESRLALGVDRVILGTVALRDPELVRNAARAFPGRIAVGIDAREGQVAVEGWLETSDATALEVAERFQDAGVAALIYTDIARDGMQTGPNLEQTEALAERVEIPVIASGGVGGERDIENAVAAGRRGLAGVIVGRALYTGAVDLARALSIAGAA